MAGSCHPIDPSQRTLPQPVLALVYPACFILPLIYVSTSQEMHRLAVLVHSFLLVGRTRGHNRCCFHSERQRLGSQSRSKSPGQDR